MKTNTSKKVAIAILLGLLLTPLDVLSRDRNHAQAKTEVDGAIEPHGVLLAKLHISESTRQRTNVIKTRKNGFYGSSPWLEYFHLPRIPSEFILIQRSAFSLAIDTNLAVIMPTSFTEFRGYRSVGKIFSLMVQLFQEAQNDRYNKAHNRADPEISSQLAAMDFSSQAQLSLVPIFGARLLARF